MSQKRDEICAKKNLECTKSHHILKKDSFVPFAIPFASLELNFAAPIKNTDLSAGEIW